MIRLQARVQPAIMDSLQRLKKRAPSQMAKAFREVTAEVTPGLLKELQKEPPRPSYPVGEFPWTSKRQWRFVMAMYKRKGITRYKRTHQLSQGWRVRQFSTKSGQVYAITNPSKVARYVYGDPTRKRQWQQGFHKQTGWYDTKELQEIINKYSGQAGFRLVKKWQEISRDLAHG